MAEQLCGSRLAHDACRFQGEIIERPITIRCNAPAHIYSACPYHDVGLVHAEARRAQPQGDQRG